MKKTTLAVLILYSNVVSSNSARVSTKNVPSDGSKVILADEFNIYRGTLYNNFSLQKYSDSWSYGIQATNIRFDGVQAQNYENDFYANLSKQFTYDNFTMEIGGQIGYNVGNTPTKLHATSSVDLQYSVTDTFMIHGGGYYINDELATIHQPYNYMAGFKYKYDKFVVLGDYYSGNNNWSGAAVNVYYKWDSTKRPYIGIIVPETNSGNEFAGVIGFSWKIF